MVITRSTQLRQRRVLLIRDPLAAGHARSHVRAAIRAWSVPVDPDIAVLLTSDLVTEAITYWAGLSVTLGIRCSRDGLRVEVTGASRPRPGGGDEPVATGCGLVLVAALSTEWGAFRAPAGQAMYFTLAFESRPAPGPSSRGRSGVTSVGTVSRKPRPAHRPH
jgi:hypothetical protein